MHISTSISSISYYILLLVIFLLPFTGISGFSFLGELRSDASAHVLIGVAIPFFITSVLIREKFQLIRNKYYFLILLFIFFVFLSSLASIASFSHVFKGKTGYQKFALQYGLLIFYGILVSHWVYNVFSRISLERLLKGTRAAVLVSYVIVAVYGFMEIAHLMGVDVFTPFLTKIEWLIRSESAFRYENYDRIRSVTPEPPFLTLYLVFATPWLLSYFITTPGRYIRNWAFLVSILSLVYYSGSRSGLIIITLEVLLFFLLQLRVRVKKQAMINIIYLSPLFVIVLLLVGYVTADKILEKLQSIIISKGSDLEVSSVSRWSAQEAAFKLAVDNPYLGVGFGQQGFYFPTYYSPASYKISYEIREWSDTNHPTWPPGFSMLTRLAAETGIFNALFFFVINILLFIKLINFRRQVYTQYRYTLTIITTCLLVSYILVYLQIDTFRLIGYWISIPLAFVLFKNEK